MERWCWVLPLIELEALLYFLVTLHLMAQTVNCICYKAESSSVSMAALWDFCAGFFLLMFRDMANGNSARWI